MKYQIQGEFVPITPLHIASGAGNVRFDFKTGRRIYGSNGGVPLTTVQTLTFLVDHEERGYLEVPCVHANTIRGGIRRCGARVVSRIFSENDDQVTLDTMLRMCTGTSTGRPNPSKPTTIEDLDRIYDNPFVGLFGGGDCMHRSRMRTGTAIPVVQQLIDLGAIPQNYAPMPGENHLRSCVVIRRVDDFLRNISALDESIVAAVQDFNKTASERIMADAQSRASRKAGDDADPKGDMVDSINALEFVNPGARFYIRFSVDGAPHHLGMFLLALQEFYRHNALGGWTRNDFGRFRLDNLYIDTGDQRLTIFKDGSDELHDDVQPFVSAFEDAADTLTPDNMDDLLT